MQADPKKVLRLLKTARGQIDGIIRMVEDDRYCMDISQQLMATAALSLRMVFFFMVLSSKEKIVHTRHLKVVFFSGALQNIPY